MEPLYRNKKTSGIYVLEAIARDRTNVRDGTEVAVYRGEDGELHVRELTEFYEKFERVPGDAS